MPVCPCTSHSMHPTGIPWLPLPIYKIIWAPKPLHRAHASPSRVLGMEECITNPVSEISGPHPRHPSCGCMRKRIADRAALGNAGAELVDHPLALAAVCCAKHHVRVWVVGPSTLTYANSYHSRLRPATDFVGKAPGESSDDMDGFAESTGRLLPFLCVVALVLRSFAFS